MRLPARSPNLNAFAERFVLSIKSECLERMVLLGETHLRTAALQYLEHYHRERPHQGLRNEASLTLGNKKAVAIAVVLGAGRTITIDVKGVAKRWDCPQTMSACRTTPATFWSSCVSKAERRNRPEGVGDPGPQGRPVLEEVPHAHGDLPITSREERRALS